MRNVISPVEFKHFLERVECQKLFIVTKELFPKELLNFGVRDGLMDKIIKALEG
jgi:hypothetical protein